MEGWTGWTFDGGDVAFCFTLRARAGWTGLVDFAKRGWGGVLARNAE